MAARLLRLLRLLRLGLRGIGVLGGRIAAGSGVSFDLDVERGDVDVGLNLGVRAIEFDGLLESGDGIDGAAEDVALGIAVDVAGGLLNLDDLRLALKIVEQKDAGIFGQAKSGRDVREVRLPRARLRARVLCRVATASGDGGAGGAIFLVFVGGGPVDERVGEFFPLFAFGAVVADAVAFDFIFGDQLVGAVFQDEAARRGLVLGCEWK